MKVTILGSGTNVPQLDRSSSAILIESGDLIILLDLGPGTIRRLLEYGLAVTDLTHVFLSHFHPDHTAELVPLLFTIKYGPSRPQRQPLQLLAGQSFQRFYNGLQAAYHDWIVPPDHQLMITELDTFTGESLALAHLRVTARPVRHRPESLAYRFEDAACNSMVYSGDTEECDSLPKLARGTDLFICDAAYPDQMKTDGHSTPGAAGRMATRAAAKRLVLTHLYPPCDQVNIVKQAAAAYKGPIIVAEDLMSFVL